jgi:RND family efflux transporter MFP subunit
MIKSIGLALAAAFLAACSDATERKPEDIRPVRVITIGESAEQSTASYAADVRARHEVRLSFRVGGKVVERLVEVGSKVRAGQPVARLDVSDLALAAASAKAQAAALATERNLAAAELARYRELREKNFISQVEFDRRSAGLEAAAAKLEAGQALSRQSANQAGYALLLADSAGVIVAIEAEAGQVVAAGQTVARLARRGELEAAFAVPEAQRALVQNAVDLTLTLNAFPGRQWKAKLRELSPAADPVGRTYAARATILGAGEDIELGMSARVAVSAANALPKLEVPVAALYSRGDQPQVFLVDSAGIVQLRQVRTAGISGERVAIESGLKPGDVVVAAGAALLRSGQRVRVLQDK